MKKLSFEQMEQVNGGSWVGCLGGAAIVGLGFAAIALGGPVTMLGAVSFIASHNFGKITAIMACGDLITG